MKLKSRIILSIKFMVFLLILGVCSCSQSSSLKTNKPNVIILYADDMGVGDVSYNRAEAKIQTPHIDLLASQGMTFTDGHSSSGICTPSRFALLTGQHHWRRFHDIVKAYEPTVFERGEYTIARMFQESGYYTGCFGKWHLGWDWDGIRKPEVSKEDWTKAESYDWTKPFRDGPLDQGFDYYFGDGTINFPPYCWIENDKFLTIPTKPVIKSRPLAGGGGFRLGPMAENWNPYDILPTITQKSIDWIKNQDSEKPFFAYLAFNSPHYPIVPNAEFHGRSKAGFYGDFVIETDAMVGKILDVLEEKGIVENTIVIFTADNGAEKHAFERLEKFDQWSSAEFRGVKRDVYEGGHRVPFIIKWPERIKAGSHSDDLVSQVDFAATFAEILAYQLNKEEAIDSYSFLPILKEEKYTRPLRKVTVHNTYENAFALRKDNWVLVDAPSGASQTEPEEYLKYFALEAYSDSNPGLLFNVEKDPRQSNNLYDAYPEKVSAMRSELRRSLY
jgi:arylsulfatase A